MTVVWVFGLMCNDQEWKVFRNLKKVPIEFNDKSQREARFLGTKRIYGEWTRRIEVAEWRLILKTPNDTMTVPCKYITNEAIFYPSQRMLESTICLPTLQHTNLFNIVNYLYCPKCAVKRMTRDQIVETRRVCDCNPFFDSQTCNGDDDDARKKIMFKSRDICRDNLLNSPYVVNE